MVKAIQDMRNESMMIGEARGKAIGKIEGKFSLLNDLVRDGIITMEFAAVKAGISVEEFEKQYSEAN